MHLARYTTGQIEPRTVPPHEGHGGFIEWTDTAKLLDSFELLRFADERDGGHGGFVLQTALTFPLVYLTAFTFTFVWLFLVLYFNFTYACF